MVIYCEVVIGVYPAIINHGIILNFDSIKFLIGFCSQELWSISIIFFCAREKNNGNVGEIHSNRVNLIKSWDMYCVSWLDNRSNFLQFYIKKHTFCSSFISFLGVFFFFNFASIIVEPKTVFFISTSVEHNQMLFKCRKRMKKKNTTELVSLRQIK